MILIFVELFIDTESKPSSNANESESSSDASESKPSLIEIEQNLIKVSPTNYQYFLDEVKDYDLRKNINDYYISLPEDKKQNFKSIQGNIYDIVNMIAFNSVKNRELHDRERNIENIYKNSLEKFFKENSLIDLKGFKLNYIPISAMKLFNDIKSIDLSETGLKTGFEGLSVFGNVNELYLSKNEITEFPDLSQFSKSLTLVDLSDNKIEEIKIDSFKNGSKSNIRSLIMTKNLIKGDKEKYKKVFENIVSDEE